MSPPVAPDLRFANHLLTPACTDQTAQSLTSFFTSQFLEGVVMEPFLLMILNISSLEMHCFAFNEIWRNGSDLRQKQKLFVVNHNYFSKLDSNFYGIRNVINTYQLSLHFEMYFVLSSEMTFI